MIRIIKYSATHPVFGPTIADLNDRHAEAQNAAGDELKRLLGAYGRAKRALLAETYDKCAYCEGYITDLYWGDVEHVLPKTGDQVARSLCYENLTAACAKCNNAKWDYEDASDPLIDPTREEPADHLQAVGPYLIQRTRKGFTTIEVIDLNREELLGKRAEAFLACKTLFDQYAAEQNPIIKRRLLARLQGMGDPPQEFSFTKRAAIESMVAGVPA